MPLSTHTILSNTTSHLILKVLPAADDYNASEHALSQALQRELDTKAAAPSTCDWTLALDLCEREGELARRRAAEFAVAADGLTDRAALEIGKSKTKVRNEISAQCFWPGSANLRQGAFDRVRAVAGAYKHYKLDDPSLPIASDNDVLVIGASYGADDYGAGKFSGVEVLVRETKTGAERKFLADVPVVVGAWLSFLRDHGASLPARPYVVCGLDVSSR